MSATLNQLEQKIRGAVEADDETGHYRCDRGIFTDQDLFDLEIKHIFEGNWVFLAHESQIQSVNMHVNHNFVVVHASICCVWMPPPSLTLVGCFLFSA